MVINVSMFTFDLFSSFLKSACLWKYFNVYASLQMYVGIFSTSASVVMCEVKGKECIDIKSDLTIDIPLYPIFTLVEFIHE